VKGNNHCLLAELYATYKNAAVFRNGGFLNIIVTNTVMINPWKFNNLPAYFTCGMCLISKVAPFVRKCVALFSGEGK